jgi:hypothetical protein
VRRAPPQEAPAGIRLVHRCTLPLRFGALHSPTAALR